MTKYLVYRHGSNAANQSMREHAPVAIVEAASAEAACEVDSGPPSTGGRYLLAAPHVRVYANQRLSAVPASSAPLADLEEAES